MHVDLWFPVVGKTLPSDHGYQLFSALCRVVPALHDQPAWGLHTLRGKLVDAGMIALSHRPRLGLRLPGDLIPIALPLVGRIIEVGGHMIALGHPTIAPLEPAKALSCRMATIKPFMEPEPFKQAVLRQLQAQNLEKDGIEVRVGKRKVLSVGDQKIVGFSVRIAGLDPRTSVDLQSSGIGGKRKLGCGVFRRSTQELASDMRP
jgi:CRISPR-associated endonuclease/helicase Cas3